MLLQLIRHKGIEHGILTDAPFVGARISAIDCHNNCPGCFNQDLRKEPYKMQQVNDIIAEIVNNPLNEGIILGGLEWTEQPQELVLLVEKAAAAKLKIIVYTHLELCKFLEKFWMIKDTPDLYVKCGEYRKDTEHYYDAKNDVTLASNNQIICKLSDLH